MIPEILSVFFTQTRCELPCVCWITECKGRLFRRLPRSEPLPRLIPAIISSCHFSEWRLTRPSQQGTLAPQIGNQHARYLASYHKKAMLCRPGAPHLAISCSGPACSRPETAPSPQTDRGLGGCIEPHSRLSGESPAQWSGSPLILELKITTAGSGVGASGGCIPGHPAALFLESAEASLTCVCFFSLARMTSIDFLL